MVGTLPYFPFGTVGHANCKSWKLAVSRIQLLIKVNIKHAEIVLRIMSGHLDSAPVYFSKPKFRISSLTKTLF